MRNILTLIVLILLFSTFSAFSISFLDNYNGFDVSNSLISKEKIFFTIIPYFLRRFTAIKENL